jgi:uncharacterized phage protein gp47/JayE
MADFGVTAAGFTIKGLDVILADAMNRAQQIFDPTIDLTATSPLRKILEVTAAEDAELWKRMEDLYYSNFLSTAVGDNLDLLGEDLGVPRRHLFASGQVQVTLANPTAGRTYLIPQGTILVTAVPVRAFFTTAALTLTATQTQGTVTIQAFERGPAGNIPANTITGVDPGYAHTFLNLGQATLTVTNPAVFTGGEQFEADDDYRAQLLGFPRNLWTVQSVQDAAASAEGVIDVRVFDPLGGVDVSQSYFNLFDFGQRPFSSQRRLGEPYFFTVVVAHRPEWPWRTQGAVQGIFEQVVTRVDAVRPVSIFPTIVEADHIEVGLEATVVIRAGFDQDALVAAIKGIIAANIGALKLGGDVLFSQVMRAFVEQTGVLDVQNLHLRRCPPVFRRISFGNVPFQTAVIEAAVGENLVMGQTEIAIFRVDSDLTTIEVISR